MVVVQHLHCVSYEEHPASGFQRDRTTITNVSQLQCVLFRIINTVISYLYFHRAEVLALAPPFSVGSSLRHALVPSYFPAAIISIRFLEISSLRFPSRIV